MRRVDSSVSTEYLLSENVLVLSTHLLLVQLLFSFVLFSFEATEASSVT
jgi:hypothetical protein